MSRIIASLTLTAALALPTLAQTTSIPASTEPIPDALDLDTALRYALGHNFAIQQARERIKEQEGLIVEVKAQTLPHLGADGQYTWTDRSLAANLGSNGLSDLQNWGVGITATQLLYAGGGVRSALDAQKVLRESILLDLQASINDALLDVRTRFYNVLLAREQIKVQEQNIQLLEEQLTIAKNRYDAGASSSFEVLRAEVSIANAKPGLIRARNSYRTAIDLLRQSLGYIASKDEDIGKTPAVIGTLDVKLETYDLASALASARENRPELKSLGKLIDAREAGVRNARSGYLPTVSAFGGYRFEKNAFRGPANGIGSEVNGWNVGVQASVPIFDGRATQGKVAQARSQLTQARLRTYDATLGVEVEVRQAYSALQEAAELIDAAQKVTSQAEEALRLANSRYAAGTATQLDVLTSQLSLTESRDNQLQANYSYNVALASLRKATGQSDPVYQVANK